MKTYLLCSIAIIASAIMAGGCASVEEIQRKADAGDGKMQYDMAIRYKEGNGVSFDLAKSEEYLKKSFENGYIPAACEIADEIHGKRNIDASEKLMECYDIIFETSTLDIPSIIAQKKFSHTFPKKSQSYFLRLVKAKKWKEAILYKKSVLAYLNKKYCPTVANIDTYRQTFIQYAVGDERNSEIDAEAANGKNSAGSSPEIYLDSESGIKLYKHIHSGLSVKYFLSTMKFPAMDVENVTRIGDSGTKYLISTYGSRKIDFIVGFQGVIGKYSVSKDFLIKQAPAGFLFGVKYDFGATVSAEALADKAKRDYPDVKDFPARKTINQFKWGRSNIDFDVVTVTRTLESERVRIVIHSCLIEFTKKGNALQEKQKQKLKEEITEGFRWTNDEQRAERLEANMPLALDGKTMIIIDKKLEQKMDEITEVAKQRDVAEKEAARKKAEQKALDF